MKIGKDRVNLFICTLPLNLYLPYIKIKIYRFETTRAKLYRC